MGIGGAGMAALALIARHRGVAITGCDTDPSGAADVAGLGVDVRQGHDPGHVAGARAVVVTAAVPRDHPELERARALGVPVVRRADALGALVTGSTLVGVAGTHGKTTTTVMVTEALVAAGCDPTGLAGGRVTRWGGNARVGGVDLFVAEADEYDRAFLSLTPAVAVVNNVEADHLECYGTVAALEDAFTEFAGRARRVIAGSDDPGAARVARAARPAAGGLGATPGAITEPALDADGSRAGGAAGRVVDLRLRAPGLHNLRNAAAALPSRTRSMRTSPAAPRRWRASTGWAGGSSGWARRRGWWWWTTMRITRPRCARPSRRRGRRSRGGGSSRCSSRTCTRARRCTVRRSAKR
jgi:UDP-N-acetylmuramate--alanine ligase